MEWLFMYLWSNLGGVLVFLLVLYISHWIITHKLSQLPPGPMPLPILGNIHLLRGGIVEAIGRLTSQYGDVMTLYLGAQPTVFLCSHDAIKEALVKQAAIFAGRPQDVMVVEDITKGLGIITTQGRVWQEQRKFVHSVLREFGMGRSILEERIQEEVGYLLEALLAHDGQPFNPHNAINDSVANIIFSILLGKRFESDNPKFRRYLGIANSNVKLLNSAGLVHVFPSLKYLPGDLFRYKQMLINVDYLKKEFEDIVREHRETAIPGERKNFIDAYTEEIEKHKDDPDTSYNEEQLHGVFGDLFVAGAETTTTSLRWALAFLLNYPDMHKRLQQEIDDVIGTSRLPSMKDRSNMVFTDAFLLEVLRVGDLAALAFHHTPTEDTVLKGHVIPAGTHVIPVLHSSQKDPKVWQNPDVFDPERFIAATGRVEKHPNFIPFGLGKRACPGEALAGMELFLFFVALVQRLNICIPDGQPPPNMKDGIQGGTRIPYPFDVCITQR